MNPGWEKGKGTNPNETCGRNCTAGKVSQGQKGQKGGRGEEKALAAVDVHTVGREKGLLGDET